MFNWLAALFQPNVDGILEDFHRVIKRLDSAVEFYNEKSARLSEKAAYLVIASGEASREAGRALRVAGQLEELLK